MTDRTDTSERPAEPPDLSGVRLTRRSRTYAVKRAWAAFNRDGCTDLAAALTYYCVQSLFPGVLALVSLLAVFGQGQKTVTTMLGLVRQLGQSGVANSLKGPITSLVSARGAGMALVIGILGALWSASGYVGAFARAMNRIYGVREGRPFWKLRPWQLLITVVLVLLAAVMLMGLIVTGPVARAVGTTMGIGTTAVTIWNWAKWPVILLVVIVMVALLYWATPNVRRGRLRIMSAGAATAILVWLVASAAFGFYVANFGKYNKTYGSLAGVIIFLLWLWLTNVALLFGGELDTELVRARQLEAGIAAEETIQLPERDASGVVKSRAKLERRVAEGRAIREQADARHAPSHPSTP